jgi:hypothetical protein
MKKFLLVGVLLTATLASNAQAQSDHLRCFKVKDRARFDAQATLTALQEQFGIDEACSIKGKAKLFCVPVSKLVTVFDDRTKDGIPPVEFVGPDLENDAACYKVKCPKQQIEPELVTDQFGTRTVEKFKSQLLCTPAVKGTPATTGDDSTGIYDHRRCYKIKDQTKFIAETSLTASQQQFGVDESCSIKGRAKLFCVPVSKQVTEFIDKSKDGIPQVQFVGQNLQTDAICYQAKCPKRALGPEMVTDQFGTRTMEKFKSQLLCTPAVKGAITTTTTTTSTTTTTLPPVCVPDCTGKTCGSDGCGGTCGTCTPPNTCVGGTCECTADCSGKCGGEDDGCGGVCPNIDCKIGVAVCVAGECVPCTADCSGKCGGEDDGCGGVCPNVCKIGVAVCVAGECVPCTADCSGKCGGEDDSCGGVCPNICKIGVAVCVAGECVPCTPDCSGKVGGDDDGCGGVCPAVTTTTTSTTTTTLVELPVECDAETLAAAEDICGGSFGSSSAIDDCILDFCILNACSPACENGSCNAGSCSCDAGWVGAACDIEDVIEPPETCVPACQNGGECVDSVCACLPGWTGERCEIAS